jgi:hypothetical protein
LAAVMIAGTIAYASGGQSVSRSQEAAANRASAGPRTAADVKGPCDEAEHANDARCNGIQVAENNRRDRDRNDDRDGLHEQEGPDDSGHHSASTVGSDNSSEHAPEMETGDDSGRAGEVEGRDDSSHHSGDSGRQSQTHGSSGRDHPEDD